MTLINGGRICSRIIQPLQCVNCWGRFSVTKIPVFFLFFLLVTIVYYVIVSGLHHKYVIERETVGKRARIRKYFSTKLVRGYTCEEDRCVKKFDYENETLLTLKTCNMLCSTPPLWPMPDNVKITNREAANFNLDHVTISPKVPEDLKQDIAKISKIFIDNLPKPHKKWTPQKLSNVLLEIEVIQNDKKSYMNIKEEYNLSIVKHVDDINVKITAPTYVGAIYALETLSQLIWLEDTNEIVTLRILHDIVVNDFPNFAHRGLMIDTARHFFSIPKLRGVMNGMVACKLNVLHLHLTDSVSFPIVLPSYPEMAKYGSYEPHMVYTPNDIIELIEYARLRGIRVVLEVDAPGHANEGWNRIKTTDDDVVICGKEEVINGHLNPDNKATLEILQNVYSDLLDLGTDQNYFHLGNDEVNTTCYFDTEASFIYTDVMDFWEAFTESMIQRLKKANINKYPDHIVIWSSPLTDDTRLQKYKKHLVVQYWLGNFNELILKGFKVVISSVSHWYLDCGVSSWRPRYYDSPCTEYYPWIKFYRHRPWVGYLAHKKQFLGGEACLWSEVIDEDMLEMKIWPRTAAMAERLWTDPVEYTMKDVFKRLSSHRERLIMRGIKNEAMWPQWCTENPGKC